MADEHDDHQIEEFEAAAGDNASLTYPVQCSALRKGGHVVIRGRPCKIAEMSTSKTGKHGHAKVNIVAIDIFTQKKLEDLSPSTHNMDVPNVKRQDIELLYVDNGFLVLQNDDGTTREDVKFPENEVGEEIQKLLAEDKTVMVTLLAAMGEEHAILAKEAPKGGAE